MLSVWTSAYQTHFQSSLWQENIPVECAPLAFVVLGFGGLVPGVWPGGDIVGRHYPHEQTNIRGKHYLSSTWWSKFFYSVERNDIYFTPIFHLVVAGWKDITCQEMESIKQNPSENGQWITPDHYWPHLQRFEQICLDSNVWWFDISDRGTGDNAVQIAGSR